MYHITAKALAEVTDLLKEEHVIKCLEEWIESTEDEKRSNCPFMSGFLIDTVSSKKKYCQGFCDILFPSSEFGFEGDSHVVCPCVAVHLYLCAWTYDDILAIAKHLVELSKPVIQQ